jgi:hypothetical protein
MASVRRRLARNRITPRVFAVWGARAEVLLTGAALGGWYALTYGLAGLLGTKVWPLSVGVLLLSGCGWKLLWRIVTDGLYDLTREEKRHA